MRVAVTGATGFVGSHVVEALLDGGHEVHAAVRRPDDRTRIGHLQEAASSRPGTLHLHRGDLLEPTSFDEAFASADGLIHVAAVALFTSSDPQTKIVDPSVQGTRHVMEAAARAGIGRVVMTSSVAAMGSIRASQTRALSEEDWNDKATLQSDPYGLAKTQAERLAWSLAAETGIELVTLQPGMVWGPVRHRRHLRASPLFLVDILRDAQPMIPRFGFGVVDVRTVARMHVDALEDRQMTGRMCLVEHAVWLPEVAALLAATYPEQVPRRFTAPDLALWAMLPFNKRLTPSLLSDALGRMPSYNAARFLHRTGGRTRRWEKTVLDTAESIRIFDK